MTMKPALLSTVIDLLIIASMVTVIGVIDTPSNRFAAALAFMGVLCALPSRTQGFSVIVKLVHQFVQVVFVPSGTAARVWSLMFFGMACVVLVSNR